MDRITSPTYSTCVDFCEAVLHISCMDINHKRQGSSGSDEPVRPGAPDAGDKGPWPVDEGLDLSATPSAHGYIFVSHSVAPAESMGANGSDRPDGPDGPGGQEAAGSALVAVAPADITQGLLSHESSRVMLASYVSRVLDGSSRLHHYFRRELGGHSPNIVAVVDHVRTGPLDSEIADLMPGLEQQAAEGLRPVMLASHSSGVFWPNSGHQGVEDAGADTRVHMSPSVSSSTDRPVWPARYFWAALRVTILTTDGVRMLLAPLIQDVNGVVRAFQGVLPVQARTHGPDIPGSVEHRQALKTLRATAAANQGLTEHEFIETTYQQSLMAAEMIDPYADEYRQRSGMRVH